MAPLDAFSSTLLYFRAVHILPNRFLGVVGQHEQYPVENLSLSHCGHLVASCSHDQRIKFWNVADVDAETVDPQRKPKAAHKTRLLNKSAAKDDFFADMAAEDEQNAGNGQDKGDSDSNSDSDDDNDDDGDANDEGGGEVEDVRGETITDGDSSGDSGKDDSSDGNADSSSDDSDCAIDGNHWCFRV